jgi:hypothetical protein
MSKFHIFRVLSLLALSACCCLPTTLSAAENDPAKAGAPRDSQSVLNGMRLKRWTKDLELTEEQQKKLQGLFEVEGREAAKINEDEALSISQRADKKKEMQEKTYEQMKPMLTPVQLENFEKIRSGANKPKPKKTK